MSDTESSSSSDGSAPRFSLLNSAAKQADERAKQSHKEFSLDERPTLEAVGEPRASGKTTRLTSTAPAAASARPSSKLVSMMNRWTDVGDDARIVGYKYGGKQYKMSGVREEGESEAELKSR